MKETELIEILIELRSAARFDPIQAMKKYDMLFLGSKMNTISVIELSHCLNKVFNINFPIAGLLKMIPTVCPGLGMKLIPLRKINNPDLNAVDDYLIELW